MPSLTALVALDFSFLATLFYAGFVGTHLPAVVLFLLGTRFSESRLSISALTWLSPPRWLVVACTIWSAAQLALILAFTFAASLSDVFLDWMTPRHTALMACGIYVPEIETLDGGGWYDWLLAFISAACVLAVCVLQLVFVHGGVKFHTLELLDPDDAGIVKHSDAVLMPIEDDNAAAPAAAAAAAAPAEAATAEGATKAAKRRARSKSVASNVSSKTGGSCGAKPAAAAAMPSTPAAETPANPPRTSLALVLVWAALCALASVIAPSYLAFPLFFLYIVVVGVSVVSPHRRDRFQQSSSGGAVARPESRTQRLLRYAAHVSLLYSSLFAALLMGAQNYVSASASNREVGIAAWRAAMQIPNGPSSSSLNGDGTVTQNYYVAHREIGASLCVFLTVYVSRILIYTSEAKRHHHDEGSSAGLPTLNASERGASAEDEEERGDRVWRMILRTAIGSEGDSKHGHHHHHHHHQTSAAAAHWWTTLFVWLVDYFLANGPLWIFPIFVVTCVSSPTFLSVLLLCFVFVASLNFELFTRYAPAFYVLCSSISISVYFVNVLTRDVPTTVEIIIANRNRDGAALPLVFQGAASGFAALSYIFFRFAEYVAKDCDRHNSMKAAAALSKLRTLYWRRLQQHAHRSKPSDDDADNTANSGGTPKSVSAAAAAASAAAALQKSPSEHGGSFTSAPSFGSLSMLMSRGGANGAAAAAATSSTVNRQASDDEFVTLEDRVQLIEREIDFVVALLEEANCSPQHATVAARVAAQHDVMRQLAMQHVPFLDAAEFDADLRPILLAASNADEYIADPEDQSNEQQPAAQQASTAAAAPPVASNEAIAAAARSEDSGAFNARGRKRNRGESFVDPRPILSFGGANAQTMTAAMPTATAARDSDAIALLSSSSSNHDAAMPASPQEASSGYTAFQDGAAPAAASSATTTISPPAPAPAPPPTGVKPKRKKGVRLQQQLDGADGDAAEAELHRFVLTSGTGGGSGGRFAVKTETTPIYRRSAVRSFVLSAALENARRRNLIDVFVSLLSYLLRSGTYPLCVMMIFITATCQAKLDCLHLPLVVFTILAMQSRTITECIWPLLCLYLMLLALFRFAMSAFDPLVPNWEATLGNRTTHLAGVYSADSSLLYLYVATALLAVAEWRQQRARLDPRVMPVDQWLTQRYDARLLSDPRVVRFYRVIGLATLMIVLGYRVTWERSIVLLAIVVLFFILAGLLTFTALRLTALWTVGVVLACIIMLLEAAAQVAVTAMPDVAWEAECDPGVLCARDIGVRVAKQNFELTALLIPSFLSVALFSAMRAWSQTDTEAAAAAAAATTTTTDADATTPSEGAAAAAAGAPAESTKAGGSGSAFTSQGFERIFTFLLGIVNLAERLLLANLRFVIWASLLFAATFNPGLVSFIFALLFVLDLRGFSVSVVSGLVILSVYVLRFALISGGFGEHTRDVVQFIGLMTPVGGHTWRLLLGPMLCFVSSLCYENLERFVMARHGGDLSVLKGLGAISDDDDNDDDQAKTDQPALEKPGARVTDSVGSAPPQQQLDAPLILSGANLQANDGDDDADGAAPSAARSPLTSPTNAATTSPTDSAAKNAKKHKKAVDATRREPEALVRLALLVRDVIHGCSYELLLLTHLIGSAVCIQHVSGALHVLQVTILSVIGRVAVLSSSRVCVALRVFESVLFLAQCAVALEPGLRTLVLQDKASTPSAWLLWLGIGELQVLALWSAFSLITIRVITQLHPEAQREFALRRTLTGGFATLQEMLKARDDIQQQLEETVAESEAHDTLLARLLAGADKVRPSSPLGQRIIRLTTTILPTAVITFFEAIRYVSLLNACIVFSGLVMLSNQKRIHWRSHVLWNRWIFFCDAIPWAAAICNLPPCAEYLVQHRIFDVVGLTREKEPMTLSALRVVLFFSAHLQRRVFEEFDFAEYLREIHSSKVDDAERHREMAERVARREQAEVLQARRERRDRQRRLEEMRRARFAILQPVTLQSTAMAHDGEEHDNTNTNINTNTNSGGPLPTGASFAIRRVGAIAAIATTGELEKPAAEAQRKGVDVPKKKTKKAKASTNRFESSSSSGSGSSASSASAAEEDEEEEEEEEEEEAVDEIFGTVHDEDGADTDDGAGEWVSVDETAVALRASLATDIPFADKIAAIADMLTAMMCSVSFQEFVDVKARYPDSHWQRLFLAMRILVEAHTAQVVLLMQLINCANSGTIFDSVLPVVGLSIAFVRSPWPPAWYWRLCVVFSMISVVTKTTLSLLASEIEFTRAAKHWLRVVIFAVPDTTGSGAGTATSGALFIDLGLDFTILFFVLVHRHVSRRLGLSDESVVAGAPSAAGSGGSALLEKSFMDNLQSRFGVGVDLYTWSVTIDGICFLIVLMGYYSLFPSESIEGGGSSVLDSFKSNLLPGPLVVALLGLLLLTVLDRVIYLLQATRAKFALQLATVLAVHATYIWWRSVIGLASGAGILLLLLKQLQCWLGATQLRRGWPLVRQHDPFSLRPYPPFYWLYLVYRSVPFLFELRVLLDWTFTRTSMPCHYWIKLEDVAHEVYMRSYDKHDHKATNPTAGFATKLIWKLLFGFLFFVGLFFLMFFPLMYYSTFNPSLVDNEVTEAEVEFMFGSISTYFRARIATRAVEPPSQEWMALVRPSFKGAQRSSGSKVELFSLAECSSFSWQISPPAVQLLRYSLRRAAGLENGGGAPAGDDDDGTNSSWMSNHSAWWNCTHRQAASSTAAAAASTTAAGGNSTNSNATSAPAPSPTTTTTEYVNCSSLLNRTRPSTTAPPPPREQIPPLTFRSMVHVVRKGSVTPEGKTANFVRDQPVAPAAAAALLALTEPLNSSLQLTANTSTLIADVHIDDFWLPVISSDPNAMVVYKQVKVPCDVEFYATIDPRTNAVAQYSCVACAPLFSLGNAPNSSYPEYGPCLVGEMSPSSDVAQHNCSRLYDYDRNQTDIHAAPQSTYFYVVNERVPTESGILPNVGIIALYTTFVLAAWRVVRGFFSGMAYRVQLEDMAEPHKVKEMIDLIYLCRESRRDDALVLEEALFFELLDLLRGPDGLLKVTGLRSQQWQNEEQEQHQAKANGGRAPGARDAAASRGGGGNAKLPQAAENDDEFVSTVSFMKMD